MRQPRRNVFELREQKTADVIGAWVMQVRSADSIDIDHLARSWHEVWHDTAWRRDAWLSCAIGNDRAARFYEKSGWRFAGTFVDTAETSNGPFLVQAWCYETRLTRST